MRFGIGAQPGDSGAPVVKVTDSPSYSDVAIYGIAVATNGEKTWVSQLGHTYNELGQNATWDACDPQFNC